MDINMIDFENFDFNLLEKIEYKHHKEIAIKLIEMNMANLVIENYYYFQISEDSNIVLKLFEKNEFNLFSENLFCFTELNNDVAIWLINSNNHKEIAFHLDIFSILDNSVAFDLIKSGFGYFVAENLNKFKSLDHNEVANKIVESGNIENLAYTLKNFRKLSNKIAMKLMEHGYNKIVFQNSNSFHKESSFT